MHIVHHHHKHHIRDREALLFQHQSPPLPSSNGLVKPYAPVMTDLVFILTDSPVTI